MPQLDNYLVTLGMKGQSAVLAQMEKIRKKGDGLAKKKTTVTVSAKSTTEKPGVAREKTTAETQRAAKKTGEETAKASKRMAPKPGEAPVPPSVPTPEREKKFSKAVDKFSGSAQNIASAASSLDPTATISSITSSLGTALSGISVMGFGLGRLPEGIAQISNSMLAMAKNSIDMAKQATAAYHQLATRNAAAEHYGGAVGAGPMSRNERAMFIDAVSGSMGKIQRPLADEINKLVGTKDTRALARTAAGDWESTGTDKGWILGQLSSSFQGLPPTVRQKLQASLLRNFSSEIQNMAPGQKAAQTSAATWANMEEDQTKALAAKAPRALGMAADLYNMQLTLYDTGLKFAGAINSTIKTLNELTVTIPRTTAALKKFTDDPSIQNMKALIKSIKVEK